MRKICLALVYRLFNTALELCSIQLIPRVGYRVKRKKPRVTLSIEIYFTHVITGTRISARVTIKHCLSFPILLCLQ